MADRLDEIAAAGRARRERAQGEKAEGLMAALGAIDPRLAEWSDSFVFGQVWDDSHLSFDEQMLVALSALGANGNLLQLRSYLYGALQAGMDPDKIQDALVMLVVYSGFPNALTVLAEWHSVRNSHERRTAGAKEAGGHD